MDACPVRMTQQPRKMARSLVFDFGKPHTKSRITSLRVIPTVTLYKFSDIFFDIIFLVIFVLYSDVLCEEKIWRGQGGEENSDEI